MTAPEKIGGFIAALRRERGMTQQDLAQRLGVTNKAVSKWERGLSCPDITLLPALADVLGVTADELLRGERTDPTPQAAPAPEPDLPPVQPPAPAGKASAVRRIFGWSLSCLMFIAIAVCIICDRAITGRLTWSLYPVSSILFVWLVLLPVLCLGLRGVKWMLAVFSLTIIPYLWVLNCLIGGHSLLLPIGILSAAIGTVYLWAVFALFRRFDRKKLLAGGVALLLAVPVRLLITFALHWLFALPSGGWGVLWDVLFLSGGAAMLFAAARGA